VGKCGTKSFEKAYPYIDSGLVGSPQVKVMKKSILNTSILAVLAIPALALAVNSGLKVGESVSAFHPEHVAGPLAGTNECFPCTFQNRPQAQVWINGDSKANIIAIAKNLDMEMTTKKSKEFKALLVMVVDDSAVNATKKSAGAWFKAEGFKNVGVAVLGKSNGAVKAYNFNTSKEVKNTVYVYKNWKVSASMTNLEANAAGLGSLNAEIAKITR